MSDTSVIRTAYHTMGDTSVIGTTNTTRRVTLVLLELLIPHDGWH